MRGGALGAWAAVSRAYECCDVCNYEHVDDDAQLGLQRRQMQL